MLGKYFRIVVGISILFISAESAALTIQSGSSVYHFNTDVPQFVVYKPKPELVFSGPYLAVNIGYGWQNKSSSPLLSQSPNGAGDFLLYTPNNTEGMIEQISLGYMFNPYFSVEIGGLHFFSSSYNINSYNYSNQTGSNGTASTTTTTYAGDFLLKASLPIKKTGLSLFAAGGGAYENAEFSSNYSNLPASNVSADAMTTSTKNQYFVPMASFGLAYAFTQHVSLLTGYTYLSGKGSLSKNYVDYLPSVGIASAGLMWVF